VEVLSQVTYISSRPQNSQRLEFHIRFQRDNHKYYMFVFPHANETDPDQSQRQSGSAKEMEAAARTNPAIETTAR
jgi:hypothetical protein